MNNTFLENCTIEEKAWNVLITDKNEGSFTVGYWYGTKSEAIEGAKFQYPNHDSYKAIAR